MLTCHRGPDFGRKEPEASIFTITSGNCTHTSLLADYTRVSSSMWGTTSPSLTIGRQASCVCFQSHSSGGPLAEAPIELRCAFGVSSAFAEWYTRRFARRRYSRVDTWTLWYGSREKKPGGLSRCRRPR